MQKLRSDSVVEANAARHLLHVGATRSHRSAISLMKVILVARNALAAYFDELGVRRSVERIGA
jgi:hypothetical protein